MSEALAKGDVGSVSVSIDTANEDEETRKAAQLPDPRGYKLLIALPEPDEMTEGGILKAAKTLHDEEVGSIVGMVSSLEPMLTMILTDSRLGLCAKRVTLS